MKKVIIIFAIVLTTLSVTSAQSLKLGGGFSYATKIEVFGLSTTAAYEINKEWEASLSYTYFFEKNKVTWSMFDINAHYIFSKTGKLAFYGLGGLNYTTATIDLPEEAVLDNVSTSETYINIGAGGKTTFHTEVEIFGEIHYKIMGEFFTINLGVLYRL